MTFTDTAEHAVLFVYSV